MSAADLDGLRDLGTRFALYVDEDTDLDRAVGLFTEDGVWEMAGQAHTGRENVRACLQGARDAGFSGPAAGTRHLVANTLVEATGPDTATGRSQWLLVRGAPPGEPPVLLGTGAYTDTYRRVDGRWLFAHRTVS